MTSRRSFLGACLILGVAPAVVRASSLMPVRVIEPEWTSVDLGPTISVDLGRTLFVDGFGGSDLADGLAWSSAFRTVEAAISAAKAGDSVFCRGVALRFVEIPRYVKNAYFENCVLSPFGLTSIHREPA